MAVFSASSLILGRVAFLTTIAYFLLVDPGKIYANVYIFGLSGGLPSAFAEGSEGFLAVLLILAACDDLMRVSGEKPLTNTMQVLPLRLVVLFVATLLAYVVKWTPLATAPTFGYLFGDTLLSGFTFLAVRDELNEDSKAKIRESRGYSDI